MNEQYIKSNYPQKNLNHVLKISESANVSVK